MTKEQTNLVLSTSLDCKNCAQPLHNSDKFCSNCAAKIVNQRITVKNLFSDFTNNVFGWDNKFFVTLRMLVLKPHILFKEFVFISGIYLQFKLTNYNVFYFSFIPNSFI